MGPYKYLVSFCGGLGPNVWDGEIVVEAEGIKEGLEKAIKQLDEEDDRDWWIVSIEQMD